MSTQDTQPVPLLDLGTARRLMAEAVAAQGPDFVYRSERDDLGCYNVPFAEAREITGFRIPVAPAGDPRETTACLVGTMLTMHGITAHREQSHIASGIRSIVLAFPGLFANANDKVCEYLATAQDAQDKGRTWGAAHAEAEAWLASA